MYLCRDELQLIYQDQYYYLVGYVRGENPERNKVQRKIEMLISIGVIILLFASAVSIMALVMHFFPEAKKLIPDEWLKWFSPTYLMYYVLTGLVLMFLG